MKLNITHRLRLLATCLLVNTFAFAQQQDPLDIAGEYIRTHIQDWNLSDQDVSEMAVSDHYTDKSTGITRVYFLQKFQGIPVHNAVLNLSIAPDGRVFHSGNRFVAGLAGKTNTTTASLTAEQAVQRAAAHFGLSVGPLQLLEQPGEREFIFEKGNIAVENIRVKLAFQPWQDEVRLAWDLLFSPADYSGKWSMRVDAVTGEILSKTNWALFCNPAEMPLRNHDNTCREMTQRHAAPPTPELNAVANGTYNVWPYPVQSPVHGDRALVADPADPVASPFGWHDTNGAPGAEFTITRGNNVHAYQDRDQSGSTPVTNSSNDEPDGGPGLLFDFPYDENWEPQQHTAASVVNLFYWANFMHDFAYHYGFDEAAGNFQQNNYGNGGQGGDALKARTQAGADVGTTDNSSYWHENDGIAPSIAMLEWQLSGKKFLTVDSPASVAGDYRTVVVTDQAGPWGAGAHVTATPVSGEIVVANDGADAPFASDACEALVNASELSGKIALIDRGGCAFGFKALQAQNAGAIAVIICNLDGLAAPAAGMTAGTNGGQVDIPVVFISAGDCAAIRQFAGNGLQATIVNDGQDGPESRDGSLDNGIIVHEYAHGITIRLTGGPSLTCLENPEQMGEGWSDFFTLATSVLPGDSGEMPRGVGTYVWRDEPEGNGVRRYPYSTDMAVNPLTYGDVAANQQIHAVGEVWASMLWDLYWALVDEYGWDENLLTGNGGNNMAIRLVMEGLKNQPCNPGFVEGRDAILAADGVLNGGANQCLIWQVFARRGLGSGAAQGSILSAGDQVEAFDLPPVCLDEMTIKKSMTDFIEAGDEIEVTIEVSNFKNETATGVIVSDEIPDGAAYKPGSSSIPADVQGNLVVFDLGEMTPMQQQAITYTLTTTADNFSERYFLDDVPSALAFDNWTPYAVGPNAPNEWQISDVFSNSGSYSWFCEDISSASMQALELTQPWTVTGDQPALRFYHRYDTQAGTDGGIVEVKVAGTSSWTQVGGRMLRNGYPGAVSFQTFVVPGLDAFSGQGGFLFRPTYVDLSDWAGQDVVVRFRFGTDGSQGGTGWFVDDVEFMDLFNYNSEACVTSNQGDEVCAAAPESGAIVESGTEVNTIEKLEDVQVAVFPNPVGEVVNVALSSETSKSLTVSILTVDGREVRAIAEQVFGNSTLQLDVRDLPGGFYILKVSSVDGVLVKKLVIR